MKLNIQLMAIVPVTQLLIAEAMLLMIPMIEVKLAPIQLII